MDVESGGQEKDLWTFLEVVKSEVGSGGIENDLCVDLDFFIRLESWMWDLGVKNTPGLRLFLEVVKLDVGSWGGNEKYVWT